MFKTMKMRRIVQAQCFLLSFPPTVSTHQTAYCPVSLSSLSNCLPSLSVSLSSLSLSLSFSPSVCPLSICLAFLFVCLSVLARSLSLSVSVHSLHLSVCLSVCMCVFLRSLSVCLTASLSYALCSVDHRWGSGAWWSGGLQPSPGPCHQAVTRRGADQEIR